MEDIKYVQLSEIAELITKGTTPTTLGYEFQDEGVKFLKIECFDENGGFIENKAAHISEECHEKLKRSQLKAGDILFSIAGAIGRVAIVSEEMVPANTNQALAIIRISDEQVYLPYIKLILTSPIVIEQFERKKQGVAQLNLSLKDINEISIPLPIKEKQIELAKLFNKVVRVISKRSMELSLLDDLIKARFVEMFGDPVVNDKRWSTMPLEEACKIIVDCPHSTPSYTTEDTGYMCIRTSIVKKNKIIWDEIEFIPKDEFEKRIKRKKPEVGDVVYTREGAILGIAAVIDKECNVALGQRAMLLSPDENMITSEFLCIAMNCDSFLINALKGVAGSASPHINVGDIKAFKMIMPPLELQNKFSDFIRQVDKSKLMFQKLHQKLNILQQKAGDI